MTMAPLDFYQFLILLSNALTIVTALIIILDDSKNSQSVIAWLLVIFLFRWIGVFFYILIGINWKKGNIVREHPEKIFSEFLGKVLERQKRYFDHLNARGLREEESDRMKCARMLISSNRSMLTVNNEVELLVGGRCAFDRLLDDLGSAVESIHMEFYIWRSDALGQKIKELLIERAAAGVEIKLLFDGLGSFRKISKDYRKELKHHGIEFAYFLDINRFLARFKVNYRNHRKIVVIDGKLAYVGGINVGEEYLDGGARFESWLDTAVRISGDSVLLLQALFLADWGSSGNAIQMDDKLFPGQADTGDIRTPVQLAFSGPDSPWPNIEQLFFQMITNTNTEIWIQSPYFIPSPNILMALSTAAHSGVKVNLMMTGVPDKRIPFWTAQSFFPSLISAGVKIYQYTGGFLHSKYLVSDRSYATLGSCNMDMRSFLINFEANAVIYDEEFSTRLVEQFQLDRERCIEITADTLRQLGPARRLRNSILRIFAPIM
jgi:cardiolipin synthase